ncbi:hypothetical protein RP20_CCG014802 [Aedes albopictus]|nr:hypothetical protein RP20_CCG014802 [Aedes albopictus]
MYYFSGRYRRISRLPKKEEPKKEEKAEVTNGETAKKDGEADKSSKDDTKETDNEDSLNLTIGEEDEKLLHDDSNVESEKKGKSVGAGEAKW